MPDDTDTKCSGGEHNICSTSNYLRAERCSSSLEILKRFADVNVADADSNSPGYFLRLLESYFQSATDSEVAISPQAYHRVEDYLSSGFKFPEEVANQVTLYKALTSPQERWESFKRSLLAPDAVPEQPSPAGTIAERIKSAIIAKEAADEDSFARRWQTMEKLDVEDARARIAQLKELRERLGGKKEKFLLLPGNLPLLVKTWMEKACTRIGVAFQVVGATHCEPNPKEYLSRKEKDTSLIPGAVHDGVKDGLLQLELLEAYLEWVPDKEAAHTETRTKAYRFVQSMAARIYCERRLNRKWSDMQNIFLSSSKVEQHLIAALSYVFSKDMAVEFLKAYTVLLRHVIMAAVDACQDEGTFQKLLEDAMVAPATAISRHYPLHSSYAIKQKNGTLKSAKKGAKDAFKVTNTRRPQVVPGTAPMYPTEKGVINQFNDILSNIPSRIRLSKRPETRAGDAKRVAWNMSNLANAVQSQVTARREALRKLVFSARAESDKKKPIIAREWQTAANELAALLEGIKLGEVRGEGIESIATTISRCLGLDIKISHPAAEIEVAVLKACSLGVTPVGAAAHSQ